MGRLCQICELQESKYKCPSCRAPYCSAACYKTHKETPCGAAPAASSGDSNGGATTATSLAVGQTHTGGTQNGNKKHAQEEQDDSIDPTKLLTAEQLGSMRQSALVKQHLANPHVRELLAQVDSSTNRVKALEKALLDPTFSTFMFRALDEIESA